MKGSHRVCWMCYRPVTSAGRVVFRGPQRCRPARGSDYNRYYNHKNATSPRQRSVDRSINRDTTTKGTVFARAFIIKFGGFILCGSFSKAVE